MIRIENTRKVGVMDKNNPPAAYCEDGDTVVFVTNDCSDGAVHADGTRDNTPGAHLANPATGPLYVNGAMPGDLLKVEIVQLKIGQWGYMGTNDPEHFYANIDIDYKRRIFDVSDGFVHVGSKTFPVNPMIGVIGVAPAGEGIRTMTPSFHGGNMDCTRIREGSVIYFPVNAPGALLAMGDLHAAMGDGEVFLYGLEINGEVTVKVSVVKGKTLRMPVLIDRGTIAAIGSAKTVDESCALAVEQLYDILIERGWDRTEAAYLLSLRCNLAVCQIVDPNMTVRAELALELVDP